MVALQIVSSKPFIGLHLFQELKVFISGAFGPVAVYLDDGRRIFRQTGMDLIHQFAHAPGEVIDPVHVQVLQCFIGQDDDRMYGQFIRALHGL